MKTNIVTTILFFTLLSSCYVHIQSCSNDVCQACFCLIDSTGSVDFNDFLTQNIIMTDNGINAQALCIIEFDVIRNGIIENIKVTSNCDFCNTAVEEAVKLSSRYWKLKPLCWQKRVKLRYNYKYQIR